MKTSAALFEAYLKCPTKCWRRAQGEVGDDNAYATRVRAQTESYATDAAKRLANEIVPPETVATAPELADLKTAKWRLALDVTVRTPETSRSSRREEAPSALPQLSTLNAKPSNQSLVTPAAAVSDSALESRLHAVERGPAEGRGAEILPDRLKRCRFRCLSCGIGGEVALRRQEMRMSAAF